MRGEVSFLPQSSSLILERYAFGTCHVTQNMPWNGDADFLTDRYEDYAQMGRYVLFWTKSSYFGQPFELQDVFQEPRALNTPSSCLIFRVFASKKEC